MIKVIENCIPEDKQDFLWELISSINFEWHYIHRSSYNTTTDNLGEKQLKLANLPGYYEFPQISNRVYDGTGQGTDILNPVFSTLAPVLCNGKDIYLKSMRVNMLFALRDFKVNACAAPHIDVDGYDENSFTAIYYLNDSDGDTVIFNEMFKDEIPEKLTEYARVTPQRGKVIVFNSNQLHSGCLPSSGRRLLINMNYQLV